MKRDEQNFHEIGQRGPGGRKGILLVEPLELNEKRQAVPP